MAAQERQGSPIGYEEYAQFAPDYDHGNVNDGEEDQKEAEKKKQAVYDNRLLVGDYKKYDQFIVKVNHPARWDNGHFITDEEHYRLELSIFVDYPKHKWIDKLANWNVISGAFIDDVQLSMDEKNFILLINREKTFEAAQGKTYEKKKKERELEEHRKQEESYKEEAKKREQQDKRDRRRLNKEMPYKT